MVIRHVGHAEFEITLEEGIRIVTDPYDASCGYPVEQVEADVALVSHHHHDHDAVENLLGSPRVLEQAGNYTLSQDARVTAIHSFHDDQQGARRGENLLFLLEAEGLRLAHMGDLGCELTEEQRALLRKVDILMIPVGGFFTITAEQAKTIADELEARVVIPMHYRTAYNADWPIEPVEAFLKLYPADEILMNAQALRIARGDLECHPHVVVLGES